MQANTPSYTREELEAQREQALALAPEHVDKGDIPSLTPEQWARAKLVVPSQESANLEMRTSMIRELNEYIRAQQWTQAQAAKALGETQPRISQLVNGHASRFSIDHLVTLLARVGISVEVGFKQAT
ncbi:MAG: hypothetical protein RhofKO_27450 [Rhodothermales bacterium]